MTLIKLKDSVSNGVKANNNISKFVIIAFVICFIIMQIVTAKILNDIRNTNIVISENGKVIPYQIIEKEALLNSTIQVHCELASNLVNAYDRVTLKSNQAKALFLVDRKSLLPIYEFYTKTGNYGQALKLGYTYTNEFKEIINLDISKYPYAVTFTSITKIYNGASLENEVLIESKGNVNVITANSEQSPQGYYITEYTQEYSKLNISENE